MVGSGTGQGTIGEVRDGSVDPSEGPGRVKGPSRRSWTGRRTLEKVWNGLGDPRGGPGRVKKPLGRSGIC